MVKLIAPSVPTLVPFLIDRPRGMLRRGSRMNVMQNYTRYRGSGVSVETFMWDIQNGYVTRGREGGWSIQQRSGIEKFNTTEKGSAEKFRVLAEIEFSGSKHIIARSGTSWSLYDEVDSFDDISGAAGRTNDEIGSVTQGHDSSGNRIFILADGGALLKLKSDLTAAALGGSPTPTKVDAVHTHQHKMWYNDRDNPMKAYYTATDNMEDHSKTGDAGNLNFETILPERDTLLGFSTIAEVYLVFHFRNFQVIYYAGTEPSEFTIQQIVPIKCYSFAAVEHLKRDLAIPSDEGINSLGSAIVHQATETDDLTFDVADLYRAFVNAVANKQHINAVYYPKLSHLYIAFPETDNPHILVYDPEIKSVVGRYDMPSAASPYSWVLRENGTLLLGGAGFVYTFDSGTNDAGTAIEFAVETPFLWLSDLERFKAPREFESPIESDADLTLTVEWWFADDPTGINPNTLTISVSANESLWQVALWQVALWRGAGTSVIKSFDMTGRGKMMAMKLSHSSLDAIIKIPWWEIRAFVEGRQ